MMYEVLETEKTLDFAEGLIGDAFTCIGNRNGYIILDTCDGVLIFAKDEVKQVC